MSGIRQFASGAIRSSDADDFRYDLISPHALCRLAATYKEGEDKYPSDPTTHQPNWKRGMPISSLMNHAIKHLYDYLAGGTDEDNLAHATWNIFAVMDFEATRPDCQDCFERLSLGADSEPYRCKCKKPGYTPTPSVANDQADAP